MKRFKQVPGCKKGLLYVICLLSFIFSGVVTDSYAGETITLVSDVYMPYTGDGEENTGYMLDIAKEVFEKKGYTVVYKLVPYARAIVETRNGMYDGMIGIGSEDAPDFVFPQNELGVFNLGFYVKKGTNWTYTGTGSLENVLVGIANYEYLGEFNDYVLHNKDNLERIEIIYSDTPLEQNLKKLVAGRIDVTVDDQTVLQYMIKTMNLDGQIVLAGRGEVITNAYIGFSPEIKTSETYARILSDGVAELRESGRLKEILEQYGLADWKK